MKHKLLTLSIVAALTACGGSDDEKATVAPAAPEFTGEFSAVATKHAETGNPSGQVVITDANPGESLFYPLEAVGTYGEFSFSANGEWTYTLWRGHEFSATPEHPAITDLVQAGMDNLYETFTVTTADGTEKPFIVTVVGIDEPATFSGNLEKAVQRDTGEGDAEGTVGVKDANPAEAYFLPVLEQPNAEATDDDSIAKIITAYGEATIKVIEPTDTATGKVEWTYDLDEMNEAVIALVDSTESLTDTFTIKSSDGTEQVITILVKGSDQVPATFVGDAATLTTNEEDGTFSAMLSVNNGSFASSIAVADLNFEEEFFNALDGEETTYGHVSIDTAGAFTYTIDYSKEAVKALLLDTAADPLPTADEVLTFTTVDGTEAKVTLSLEAVLLEPAVFDGYPVVTDGVSSSTVDVNQLQALGSLSITDANAWQASFMPQEQEPTTYGFFSINEAGTWSYTLSDASVALIDSGTLTLPVTEHIKVTSADGSEVTVPVSIIAPPKNKYIQISSKGGAQGIFNIDGFGKEKKGKLNLNVRMSDGPGTGYAQLFGASSNGADKSMTDLQLKPGGIIDIRGITDEDPSVTYKAGEWFPVEMTWDSTQSPAQMSVSVNGQLVSDFATPVPTTVDVSDGAFRLSFRCGSGKDSSATLCDFDNLIVTQFTASGDVIAVNEDFQGFDLGEVDKADDTPLVNGGKIKKHSKGYQHINSEILEED